MQEEKAKILNMVKEGKLTTEEALILLDELGKQDEAAKKKEESLVNELSTVVKPGEEKKQEQTSTNEKVQSAKDKIFEFIDTAIQKIKDFDLDFNFGKSVDITHIFQQSDVYLKELDIDIANGSVKILPWDEKNVRIECDAKVYRVETPDDARESFLRDVIFSVEGQRLRFICQQKWMKVNASLFIPQEAYDNVRIRLFNGSIESENLYTDKYRAKTANGKISMYGMTSRDVEVETANGKIDVQAGRIDEFDAETINGAITLQGSIKKADIQSFNGDIECTFVDDRCEFVEAKATTGAIKLYVPEGTVVSGEIRSNLGNLNLGIEGVHVTEEKKDVIQKVLRFRPILDTGKETKVLADSKTGSVTLGRKL